jgi:hypothetical protein
VWKWSFHRVPSTTDRMQPLDVAFMKPFKTYYAREMANWMAAHPGRTVTAFQIAHLMGQADIKAGTVQIATSCFRATGILPFILISSQSQIFLPVQENRKLPMSKTTLTKVP